jgi:hypothetical protein
LSQCADRHKREENSLSSGIWRKIPLRDLHRVDEHPTDSAKICLSRRIARRASIFLHLQEKGRRIKSLRGLSTWKSSEEIALQCAKTLQECRGQIFKDLKKNLRRNNVIENAGKDSKSWSS